MEKSQTVFIMNTTNFIEMSEAVLHGRVQQYKITEKEFPREHLEKIRQRINNETSSLRREDLKISDEEALRLYSLPTESRADVFSERRLLDMSYGDMMLK